MYKPGILPRERYTDITSLGQFLLLSSEEGSNYSKAKDAVFNINPREEDRSYLATYSNSPH